MPTEQQNPDSAQQSLDLNFSQLILGFSSAALHYLGEQDYFGEPGSRGAEKANLELARHNIEIIDLLSEKTRGNLDEDEAKLLREVLTDLKMKYVEATRRQRD